MNEKNIRLVTAESVRAGHPDKFCDQVADAILDAHLRQDPNARVAVEVFATAGKIVVGGEITSKAEVDGRRIVAGVINRISYTMSDLCGDPHELLELEVCLHEQSPDISAAVGKTELGAGETLGAGDQGIMLCHQRNGRIPAPARGAGTSHLQKAGRAEAGESVDGRGRQGAGYCRL